MKTYKQLKESIIDQILNRHKDKYCLISGNCMYKSYEISKDMYQHNISHYVVEGWISFVDNCYDVPVNCDHSPWLSHTWIQLMNGAIIDITKEQFSKLYDTTNAYYKTKRKYKPKEYYELEEKYGKPVRFE